MVNSFHFDFHDEKSEKKRLIFPLTVLAKYKAKIFAQNKIF